MSKRIIAIICLLAMLLGFIPAAAIVASAEGEGQYQVGYAKLDINPFIKNSFTGDLGVDDTTYSDAAEYRGTIQIHRPGTTDVEDVVDIDIVKIPLGGYGNADTRLADKLSDDNGDGYITLGDGLHTTATVVTDAAGNTVIYLTLDALDVSDAITKAVRIKILNTLGRDKIKSDQIIVSGSHTHEGPDLASISGAASGTALAAYYQYMLTQMTNAAVQAYQNRAEATMSKGEIDASNAMKDMNYKYSDGTGYKMNFTRHYEMTGTDEYDVFVRSTHDCENGYHDHHDSSYPQVRRTYKWYIGDNFGEKHGVNMRHIYTNENATYPSGYWEGEYYNYYTIKHIADADDTMQVLKFDRDDPNSDVVLINWQAHASHLGHGNFTNISSDYINALRYYLEDLGYSVAFWQGTSGNLNGISSDVSQFAFDPVKNSFAGYGTIRLSEVKVPFAANATSGFYNTYYSSFGVDSEGVSNYNDEAYLSALYGYLLGKIAEKCLVSSNMVAVDQGEVRVLPLTYRVDHRTYSSTWGAVATEWNAAKDAGTISSYPWSSTNYPGYGVNSELHGNNLVLRANNNSWQGVPAEDTNITLNVITMGSNVAILTCSGELFDNYDLKGSLVPADNDWEELEETLSNTYGNPFVVTHALDDIGYIPNSLAYTYKVTKSGAVLGSYESNMSYYGAGTGEAIVQKFKTILDSVSDFKEGYCQHCKKDVLWSPISAENGDTAFANGHYYLADDIARYGYVNPKNIGVNYYDYRDTYTDYTINVCLDLNGHSIQSLGRAFFVGSASVLSIMDTVGGGEVVSAPHSGSAAGGVFEVNPYATLNLYGGTFRYEGGTATVGASLGGVVALQGTMNIYDGATLIGGQMRNAYTSSAGGTGNGGAICAYGGSATLNIYGGRIISGKVPENAPATIPNATYNQGPCVYFTGGKQLLISGNANIDDIFFTSNDGKLIVKDTFTGKLGLSFKNTVSVTDGLDVGTATNANLAKATITCTNQPGASLCVDGSDLKVVVPGDDIVLGITAKGAVSYASLAEAAAATNNGYLKLIKDIDTAELNSNARIDLAGHSISALTIKQGQKAYVMDSANDDFDGFGTVTLTAESKGHILAMPAEAGVTENTYIKHTDGNNISFHRVQLDVVSMTTRTKDTKLDLQYNCAFNGDSMVKGMVAEYGVAASITGVPDVDNMTNRSVYTTDFGSGEVTGTWIYNIVKTTNTAAKNKNNAEIDIYGRPYIKLSTGEYLFGYAVARNLREQVEATEYMWDELNLNQRNGMVASYKAFSGLDDWNAPKLKAAANDDDVLRVLILGNSHGLDATNFLAEVFKAEAPGKKVVIGALYYDGCNIAQHANFLTNNAPVYDYYKNATFDYSKGVNNDGTWRINFGAGEKRADNSDVLVTAQAGLTDEEWDIIVMQQMNHRSGRDEDFVENQFKTVISYLDSTQNSDATLLWHMVWANPDTEDYLNRTGDENNTLDHPNRENWLSQHDSWFPGENGVYVENGTYDMDYLYSEIVRCAKTYITTNSEFTDIIPSGTAIQYALNEQGRALSEMYRDYTHMSDYGRLVAAYCWYATIMGIDQLDSVNIGNLPAALHHSKSTYPTVSDSLIQVSDADKTKLMAAVNYALANPLTNPGYTN